MHPHRPRRLVAVTGLFLSCALHAWGVATAGPLTSFSTWSAGAATPLTTITFEDRTAFSTLVGNEYAGLTISQRDTLAITVVAVNSAIFLEPGNFNSGTRGVASSWNSSGGFTDASDNLDFTFTTPVRSAGLWIGNLGSSSQPTVVQFLGGAGSLLGDASVHSELADHIGSGYTGRLFVGLNLWSADIEMIRVVNGANDSDGIVIDDVTFSADAAVPVPEGGSVTLMAAGLAAGLLARRRRA